MENRPKGTRFRFLTLEPNRYYAESYGITIGNGYAVILRQSVAGKNGGGGWEVSRLPLDELRNTEEIDRQKPLPGTVVLILHAVSLAISENETAAP